MNVGLTHAAINIFTFPDRTDDGAALSALSSESSSPQNIVHMGPDEDTME
jgi:hypothetical protein